MDNIYDNKEWIKISGETINDYINRWEKKHAVVVPGAEPYLKDVLEYLRNNIENIKQIIFPDV